MAASRTGEVDLFEPFDSWVSTTYPPDWEEKESADDKVPLNDRVLGPQANHPAGPDHLPDHRRREEC